MDYNNPFVQSYRKKLESRGVSTSHLTNRDIVKQIGDDFKKRGATNSQIERDAGQDFLNQYLEISNTNPNQGMIGDAAASFRRQAIGLGEIGLGGVGLAADFVGLDSVRDAAMRKAAELSQYASEGPQPTIESYADVRPGNLQDIGRYAANLIGGAAPSVLESAATFGAGGIVGVGLKGAIKNRLRKETTDLAESQIEKLAMSKAFQKGALASLGTSSALMGTGEVYAELYPYTQLDVNDEDYIDPKTARNASLVGGALVAGLDFASAGNALNKLIGIGQGKSSDYLKRLIGNLPEGVFLEGATESMQELIIMAAEKYSKGEEYEFTDLEIERLINAGIMGAVGGAQFTAIGALRGPNDPKPTNDKDDPKVENREVDIDETLKPSGETQGFKVGDQVVEPFGVSGEIVKIEEGVATLKVPEQGMTGVGVKDKLVRVPAENLAPLVEKPVEETVEATEEAQIPSPEIGQKVEETEVKAKEEKVEVTEEDENIPQDVDSSVRSESLSFDDDYAKFVKAKDVQVDPVKKRDAIIAYEALKKIFNKKGNKILNAQTNQRSVLEQQLTPKQLAAWDRSKKVLREAGILAPDFKWKQDTAAQLEKESMDVEEKEQKELDRRNAKMENWQAGGTLVLKNATPPRYYTIVSKDTETGNIEVQETDAEGNALSSETQSFNPSNLATRTIRKKKKVEIPNIQNEDELIQNIKKDKNSLSKLNNKIWKSTGRRWEIQIERQEIELENFKLQKNPEANKDAIKELERRYEALSKEIIKRPSKQITQKDIDNGLAYNPTNPSDITTENFTEAPFQRHHRQKADNMKFLDEYQKQHGEDLSGSDKYIYTGADVEGSKYTDIDGIPEYILVRDTPIPLEDLLNHEKLKFSTPISSNAIQHMFQERANQSSKSKASKSKTPKTEEPDFEGLDLMLPKFNSRKGSQVTILGEIINDKGSTRKRDIDLGTFKSLEDLVNFLKNYKRGFFNNFDKAIDVYYGIKIDGKKAKIAFEKEGDDRILVALRNSFTEPERFNLDEQDLSDLPNRLDPDTKDPMYIRDVVFGEEFGLEELTQEAQLRDNNKTLIVLRRATDSKSLPIDSFRVASARTRNGKLRIYNENRYEEVTESDEGILSDYSIVGYIRLFDKRANFDSYFATAEDLNADLSVGGYTDGVTDNLPQATVTSSDENVKRLKGISRQREISKRKTFGKAEYDKLLEKVNKPASNQSPGREGEFGMSIISPSVGPKSWRSTDPNIIHNALRPSISKSEEHKSKAEIYKNLINTHAAWMATSSKNDDVSYKESVTTFVSNTGLRIDQRREYEMWVKRGLDTLIPYLKERKVISAGNGVNDSNGNQFPMLDKLVGVMKGENPIDRVITQDLINEAKTDIDSFIRLFGLALEQKNIVDVITPLNSATRASIGIEAGLRAKGKASISSRVDGDPIEYIKDEILKDPADQEKLDEVVSELDSQLDGRFTEFLNNVLAGRQPNGANNSKDVKIREYRTALVGIDNLIDPATGEVANNGETPTDAESLEREEKRIREDDTRISAPEHPLRNNPELLSKGKDALRRFESSIAPGAPFSAVNALRKIASNLDNGKWTNTESISHWVAQLIDNPVVKKLKFRFPDWQEFGTNYADPSDGKVTTAVFNIDANEVLISDAFYTDSTLTPDEALASKLIHEIAHAPIRLSMEAGYAYSRGDEGLIRTLSTYGVKGETLAKVYEQVETQIIPFLRSMNSENGRHPYEHALSSVEEFFAELSSNYDLRSLLKKTKLTPELSKKLGVKPTSVWQWVKNLIMRLLGVQSNLLDLSDKHLDNIIKMSEPLAKYNGELPHDTMERKSQMLLDFEQTLPARDPEPEYRGPTFWQLFGINPKDPNVYDKVADVTIITDQPNKDGENAELYYKRLGLEKGKLLAAMERAHARDRRKNQKFRKSRVVLEDEFDNSKRYVAHKLREYAPANTKTSLSIIRQNRTDIVQDYYDAFDQVEPYIISAVINEDYSELDKAEAKYAKSITVKPNLKALLRGLQNDDFFGDTPSFALKSIFEEDVLDIFDVSGVTKTAISRYANSLGSRVRESRVDLPKPDPDANAKVFHRATASAMNELSRELVKVYTELANTNKLPDEYKGKDGAKKFIQDHSKGINLEEMYGVIASKLGVEQKSLQKISVNDHGMNRVARDWGIRDGVRYLSLSREKARKEISLREDQIDGWKAQIALYERLTENTKKGKLPSTKELGDALAFKVSNIKAGTLERILEKLKNPELITLEKLNSFKDRKDLKAKMLSTMEAISQMSGAVEELSLREIVSQISQSRDPALSWLQGDDNVLARHAVASVVRNSKDIFTLYRVATDLPSDLKSIYLNAIEQIAKADTLEKLEAVDLGKAKGRLGTSLKNLAENKKQSIIASDGIQEAIRRVAILKEIDVSLMQRENKLRTALGELEPVDIRSGARMITMTRKRDASGNVIPGEWERGYYDADNKYHSEAYVVRYDGGKLADRDLFVKINAETLMFTRDPNMREKYKNQPWFDIMHQQAMRALHEPVNDKYFSVRKAAWMQGIESLHARANRLGFQGKKLGGMLARTAALFRDLQSDQIYYSKRWNVAYLNLMEKLGVGGKELFTGFYQDIWWWMDNHPEYADNETEALNALWKDLRKKGNVPNKANLNNDSRNALKLLVERTIAARDWEKNVNMNVLGNRIKDDEVSVQSMLNGEMVDLYRRPLDMGYATIPRVLNTNAITSAIRLLKAPTDENMELRGKWIPTNSTKQDKNIIKELDALLLEKSELDQIKESMSKLFSDDVVDRWVTHYLSTDNRMTVFQGPNGVEVGNSYINALWQNAQKTRNGKEALFEFLSNMYLNLADTNNESTMSEQEWFVNFTKQMQTRFDDLHRAWSDMQDKNDPLAVSSALQNTPRSLDNRQLASKLPKEYFYYDSYDEVTGQVRLQLNIATSVFGRGGSNANEVFSQAQRRYEERSNIFLDLLTEATGEKHTEVVSGYSKDIKKLVYEVIRSREEVMNGENPKKVFEDLFADASAYRELSIVFDQLGKYYGKGNVAGPFKDANVPLELLGLQSLSVLNNPKSSFWQMIGPSEFPMAFRGLNKRTAKASIRAYAEFLNQTFGGMLESMGVQISRVHRYSKYLNNTHFHTSESNLTRKEYTTNVGTGGEMTGFGMDSMSAKKAIRKVKQFMMYRKANKVGDRSPVDLMTPLTGLFPYINSNVNHGAGVGAIFYFEDMVLQVAKAMEAQGVKTFRNFSAEELGLGGGTLEWMTGEAEGYNQANELLEGVGLPNVSRMAFDFIERKKIDPNAVIINKDAAILINQIAMNEVIGEGFNAKPAFLYTNPVMRYAGIFLGWPLWKMARDNRSLQRNRNYVFGEDPREDMRAVLSFIQYLGMVSAVYAPIGLSFASLVDWYDDEILEKPNNLPPLDPLAKLPIFGPVLAAQSEQFTMYSITGRLAKAGVPYGLGVDLMNSLFSSADPYGASRELTLDSRIFAWSMISNIKYAMTNWLHQGEVDYQNVTRPIIFGLGGNSALQFIDAASAMLDIDSEERRIADYIGARNLVKKGAWMMGLDLRIAGKGGVKPTPISINIRQMERAAYNYDTDRFMREYQEAVEAAREKGKTDPEKYVADSFKQRLIKANLTERTISDEDWETLLSMLEPEEAERLRSYVRAHSTYLNMIKITTPPTYNQTMRAYSAMYGDTSAIQARQIDPRLYALIGQ